MADGFDVDFSEFERLSVDIGRASAAVIGTSRAVVKKGLDNIKKDTIANIPDRYWGTPGKGPSLKGLVSYDIVGLWGEVGYEDRGRGELAGIYEFGSARRDPHPTLYPAAGREAPRFEKAIVDAAAQAVEDLL
jgi:hypothetical protein